MHGVSVKLIFCLMFFLFSLPSLGIENSDHILKCGTSLRQLYYDAHIVTWKNKDPISPSTLAIATMTKESEGNYESQTLTVDGQIFRESLQSREPTEVQIMFNYQILTLLDPLSHSTPQYLIDLNDLRSTPPDRILQGFIFPLNLWISHESRVDQDQEINALLDKILGVFAERIEALPENIDGRIKKRSYLYGYFLKEPVFDQAHFNEFLIARLSRAFCNCLGLSAAINEAIEKTREELFKPETTELEITEEKLMCGMS